AHAFGQTQQFWLFAPWADVQAAIELLRQDAEAVAKAGGKTAARSPQDPCVLAFARWRKAQQRFFDSLGPCRPAEDGAQAPGKEEHRPEAIEQAAHEQQQHG
ncbi:MAG TPA: hypothetical protein DCS43_08925, partial [Verrucomicrobia bacterium]|nr:hypothetical protein [Verrucomicrobiota bacterium]